MKTIMVTDSDRAFDFFITVVRSGYFAFMISVVINSDTQTDTQ